MKRFILPLAAFALTLVGCQTDNVDEPIIDSQESTETLFVERQVVISASDNFTRSEVTDDDDHNFTYVWNSTHDFYLTISGATFYDSDETYAYSPMQVTATEDATGATLASYYSLDAAITTLTEGTTITSLGPIAADDESGDGLVVDENGDFTAALPTTFENATSLYTNCLYVMGTNTLDGDVEFEEDVTALSDVIGVEHTVIPAILKFPLDVPSGYAVTVTLKADSPIFPTVATLSAGAITYDADTYTDTITIEGTSESDSTLYGLIFPAKLGDAEVVVTASVGGEDFVLATLSTTETFTGFESSNAYVMNVKVELSADSAFDAAHPNNLIVNGDFEDGLFGWTDQSGAYITENYPIQGSKTLIQTESWKYTYQTIAVEPNTTYVGGFTYRRLTEEGDEGGDILGGDGNGAYLLFSTDGSTTAATTKESTNVVTANGYFSDANNNAELNYNNEFSGYYTTGADVNELTIFLGSYNSNGCVYFDEVYVEKYTGATDDTDSASTNNLIQNGTFENGTMVGWYRYSGTAHAIVDDSSYALSGNYSLCGYSQASSNTYTRISQQLTGLTPNTTYYYGAKVRSLNSYAEALSEVLTTTTSAQVNIRTSEEEGNLTTTILYGGSASVKTNELTTFVGSFDSGSYESLWLTTITVGNKDITSPAYGFYDDIYVGTDPYPYIDLGAPVLTISGSSDFTTFDDSLDLTCAIENNTGYPLSWSSSNTDVVDNDLNIVGTGSATITASVTYNGSTVSKAHDVYVDGPLEISTAAELVAFQASINDGTAEKTDVLLTEDIDLSGIEWTPIATYSGTFDGGGKTISNLTISSASTEGQGLFGITETATIKNLTISGASVTNSANETAALIGLANVSGGSLTLTDVTVSDCTINGVAYVGGLVGSIANLSSCTITGCEVTSTMSGDTYNGKITGAGTYVGGVIGNLNVASSTIDDCSNSAYVYNSSTYTGGIVGVVNSSATSSKITGCSNSGYVSNGGQHLGGIIGGIITATSTITNCDNTGTVYSTAGTYAAGILGSTTASVTVTACYNAGTITNTNANGSGGIIGYTNAICYITGCYNVGYINGGTKVNIGGIVGHCNSKKHVINSCYNTSSITGGNYSGAITGLDNGGSTLTDCYTTVTIASVNTTTGNVGYDGTKVDDIAELNSVVTTMNANTTFSATAYMYQAGATDDDYPTLVAR